MEFKIIIPGVIITYKSPASSTETTWTTLVNYMLIKDNSLSLAFETSSVGGHHSSCLPDSYHSILNRD